MNTRTIGIIIRREYLNRVKKKSFLLITFLSPILFSALCIAPALLMTQIKDTEKKIAVVDESGIVLPKLVNSKSVVYEDCFGKQLDSVKMNLEAYGYDAVLSVSPINEQERTVSASLYSLKPVNVELAENITSKIDDAVEAYRIESYDIENLDEIMQEVKSDINLRTYTIFDDGEEKVADTNVYMIVSMLLGLVLYMFIVMFGSMVMSSVIEEKSSRVVEVLISSVKATELMFGKIIGIALVALTQFFLWIILTFAIVSVVGAVSGGNLLGGADPAEITQMAQMGGGDVMGDVADLTAVATTSDGGALSAILSTLGNMHLGLLLVCFVIYFVFGYMLYASLFAAVGSAVENEGDSNQLQLPITIPLIIAFFIAIYAFRAPDSGAVVWGSLIPFTSPIVMLARLPFGVPYWELILSIVLLIGTFVLCAWISAKIYKVGILMFGKKTTWKDLWKWLKQK